MTAIIHKPSQTTTQWSSDDYPEVQSHVNPEKTVSFFYVQWEDTKEVGMLDHPHFAENECDGGTIQGEFCLCDTTLEETVAHSSLPNRDEVLQLKVGAFDPTMYEYNTLVESSDPADVSVYTKENDYSIDTVFRIVHNSKHVFFKNMISVVEVCNGLFKFRNSPTFYDIADPQLISAYQETEAYIDYVHNHASAPPFVCSSLLKHFGYSNPSPNHVLACSNAFKAGTFNFANPEDANDAVPFGVAGQRGNLAAVAASIVLHDDALSAALDLDPAAGGTKSPLLKLTQTIRSFKLTRTLHHRRTDGLLRAGVFGEGPYDIPDQFSFYSPFFLPAGAHQESSVSRPFISYFVVNLC